MHKAIIICMLVFSALALAGCTDLMGKATTTTGNISVSSTPTGARIYVDNIDKGLTPKLLTASLGNHSIRLVRSGYEQYNSTVNVLVGKTASVNVALKPTTGAIYVTSTPIQSTFYVNGLSRGLTSKTLTSLTPGSYTVVVTRAGYANYTTTVKVSAGNTTSVNAVLKKLGNTTN